ncbi:MAG: hypothetical protein FJ276_09705 [Planctomycetes bacterium]|nr:hypothetical protein [Planctomycetota bacterium]
MAQAAPDAPGLRADVELAAGADNLALGRPYTFNVWPKTRRSLQGDMPDYLKVLTDGKLVIPLGVQPTGERAGFEAVADVQVTVDLGEVRPIAEIFARHDANVYDRMLPRREEYYVSDDGRNFFKVAECANAWDAQTWTAELGEDDFFSGVKKFSSGPLKTSGRYVMVRAFPAFIGGQKQKFEVSLRSNYIGFDEIVVRKGEFSSEEAQKPAGKPFVPAADDLPSEVLGYRYGAIPYHEVFKDGPFFMTPTPYGYLREPEFHLSQGGVFIMAFQTISRGAGAVTSATLECAIPASVELVATGQAQKMTGKQPVTIDGIEHIRYTMKLDDASVSPDSNQERGAPSLVLACDKIPLGQLGKLVYTYSYTCAGNQYKSTPAELMLVQTEPIRAEAPKEFIQGIYLARVIPRLSGGSQTIARLLKFYSEAGFNSIFGGSSPETYSMGKKLGLTFFANGGQYFPNGYQFALGEGAVWKKIPEDGHFKLHPKFERTGVKGICPELLNSPEFFPNVKEVAGKFLKTSDHMQVNWEPYSYVKRGCVCERCRKAFIDFARTEGKMTAEDAEAAWPACVIDPNSDVHNRFTGRQMALTHGTYQRATTEASKELGRTIRAEFMPAVASHEFNPEDLRWVTNGTREYFKYVESLTTWGFPYDVNLGVVNIPRNIGNAMLMLEAVERALAIREEYVPKNDDRRPRIYNISGIQFGGERRVAMPRDFYMTTMMNFVAGIDGHASYREFGVDARYLRLRAKAAQTMAAYEKYILHGARKTNYRVSTVSPVPDMKGRDIFMSRSYEHDGRQIVALGNDYVYTVFVQLEFQDLSGKGPLWLIDRINGKVFGGKEGYSAETLAKGVLVDVPGKEFRILEVSDKPAEGLPGADEKAMQEMFQAQKPNLAEQAEYIESLLK